MSTPDSLTEQETIDLVNEAIIQHQQGNLPEAEKIYRLLIENFPGFWQFSYNLGILLSEDNRFEEAIKTYRNALRYTEADHDLYFNLAFCLKKIGKFKAALEYYNQALALKPGDIDSLYNLAGCQMAAGMADEAFLTYQDVLDRDPQHQSALNNQAYLCHKMGKTDLAIDFYTRLLDLNPRHQSADHMLAALTGEDRATTPSAYIRDVFDSCSDHYENNLVNDLKYTLPEKLKTLVLETTGRKSFQSILDLGCGTGLMGECFRDIITLLDGVDLSAGMAEKARNKKIYDNLAVAEINDYLQGERIESYDLMIAADVFTYLGQLETVLNNSLTATRTGGFLFFSVEHLEDGSGPMALNESGRFSHSGSYIKVAAKEAGWDFVTSLRLDLRRERDSWIIGSVYALKKTSIS